MVNVKIDVMKPDITVFDVSFIGQVQQPIGIGQSSRQK